MIREERLRILQELQNGIDNGITADAGGILKAPVTHFTCPDLLQKEQQVFFRESPILLGMSVDLPGKGSYLATNETGVPILMTRDNNGKFHAFFNVCRHRGAQVVLEGRGNRDRFACPFHAWTYSNSGKLLAVNKEQSFGCVDKNRQSLVEIPAQEKYGMLWVLPTPGRQFDVDEILGGLATEMGSWDLHDIEFKEEQILKADINWKLAIDTFGENYHFDVLHKETLAPEIFGNLQTNDVFGRNYRMVFALKGGFNYVHEKNMPIEEWPFRWITLGVYFLYPNIIFLVDRQGIDLLRMYPDENNPGKSRTHHRFYLGREMREHLKRRAEEKGNNEPEESRLTGFNRVVVQEDYVMAASIQVGASSGAQTHLTFGRNEPALHHYHNTHRAGLGLAPLELEPAPAEME